MKEVIIPMPDIQYLSDFHPGFILLSDEFILRHMPAANGTYVKVFLYAYQQYTSHSQGLTTQSIAKALSLIESDVLEAFHYWQGQGLMMLETEGEALSIGFAPGGSRPTPPNPGKKEKVPEAAPPASKVVRVEHKPVYSPEELAVYQTNPKIGALFNKAAKSLGAPLSPPNLSLLFSFYDYYRLPVDVIEYLIDYCLANGGRSLRYMERVAQDWADQNIQSLDAAKAYVDRFVSYRPIMNALHLKGSRPSDTELAYMDRWFTEYQMPADLIIEACRRTFERTGKPSLSYADSILQNWADQGIRTMEAVSQADESFARSQGVPVDRPKNAFHNFTPRADWDYDTLEKLAQDQLYSERKQN